MIGCAWCQCQHRGGVSSNRKTLRQRHGSRRHTSRIAHATRPALRKSKSRVIIKKKWLRCSIFDVCLSRQRSFGDHPTEKDLDRARRMALRAFDETSTRRKVAYAFYQVTRELHLRFGWEAARLRIQRAKFSRYFYLKDFDENSFALSIDDGRSMVPKILISPLEPFTTRSLAALIFHEALHWLAKRERVGNPFIKQDTEHLAMEMLGDPQM